MHVLVINAGSSTLKWTLLDGDDRSTLASGSEEWAGTELERRGEQIRRALHQIPRFDVVGHRVVHGGRRMAATVIDREVRAELDRLALLDPLHMRPALAGIDAVSAEFPSMRQVAAFDTSFHADMPEASAGYALPFEWSERWSLRRYGFHGISVQWALGEVRRQLGHTPARMIVCHLGSGCSVTAVANGRSIDTTMGFTPLEGVMMATRSGSVDPGLLLHLQLHRGIGAAELEDVLAHRSGLLGVSGVSGDLRRILATDSPRARLAYDQFIWTLRRAVGAMAGVLGGVDTLVFTGGIGENQPRVRADVSAALAFVGRVSVLVVHAREDLVILDAVIRVIG
jgi:acetate kinase